MLFHITYTLTNQTRDTAQKRFKETGGGPPEGAKMLGRWHCAQGLKGFVLAEATDAVAITTWMQQWTDLLTFEVNPVVDDDQMLRVLGG
jgi:hypothetical protein